MKSRSARSLAVALVFASLAVGLVSIGAQAAAIDPPTFLTKWGTPGAGDGQFALPAGVATDTGGVYVADTSNHRIQVFDHSGNFMSKWGSYSGINASGGTFNEPYGVAVDPSTGNVYVSDTNNNRIQKFSSSGTFISTWGSQVSTGAFAFTICTSYCQGGYPGETFGAMNSPHGVASDASGNVFVTDTVNNRIEEFGPSGIFIRGWGWNVDFTAPGTGFEICTTDCQKGTSGSGDGQLSGPWGVAVDTSGNVYVADTGNHRVQKFDSSGNFLTKWGTNGAGNGQFAYPRGVAVDAFGNVYVSDYDNNRIQKFDALGTYLTEFGSPGSGDGQFSAPIGVATDASGNVYVVERNNTRIQKFGYRPTALSIKAKSPVAKGTKVAVTGVLSSDEPTCTQTQQVNLKKGSVTLQTKETSASGTYKFIFKVTRRSTVQVTYDGGPGCAASASAKKTIKVT